VYIDYYLSLTNNFRKTIKEYFETGKFQFDEDSNTLDLEKQLIDYGFGEQIKLIRNSFDLVINDFKNQITDNITIMESEMKVLLDSFDIIIKDGELKYKNAFENIFDLKY